MQHNKDNPDAARGLRAVLCFSVNVHRQETYMLLFLILLHQLCVLQLLVAAG